jgi:hypothetical protein
MLFLKHKNLNKKRRKKMKKLISISPMGGVAIIGLVMAIVVITGMVLTEKYYTPPKKSSVEITEQIK